MLAIGCCPCIRIGVESTAQPDRVRLGVATHRRIVVSEVVVVQPDDGVVLLAGEPQVVLNIPRLEGFSFGIVVPNGSESHLQRMLLLVSVTSRGVFR